MLLDFVVLFVVFDRRHHHHHHQKAGFARFGVDLKEDEMLVLIEELDEDKSGDISVEEFRNLLRAHNHN